ncbi:hypothetical protein ACLB2K_065816 [Fragaria x ananassa]
MAAGTTEMKDPCTIRGLSMRHSKLMLLRRRRGNEEDENASDFVVPPAPVGQKKQIAWPNSTVQLLWRKGDCCVCLARFRSRFFELYVLHVVIFACWFRWYEQWWEKAGYFVADAKSSKPLFVIVLPPSNVTGTLHIAHVLTAAVEASSVDKFLHLLCT